MLKHVIYLLLPPSNFSLLMAHISWLLMSPSNGLWHLQVIDWKQVPLAAYIWGLNPTQMTYTCTAAECVCEVWSEGFKCWWCAWWMVCCSSLCSTPEPLQIYPWPCQLQAARAPRSRVCSSRGELRGKPHPGQLGGFPS